jgi:O-methyltransferase involved in polyketide biosynthesis
MTTAPAAAQTAFGPMVIAACEQHLPAHQRLFDDPDAARLLPAGQRLVVGACRWKPVHRLLMRATDSKAEGLWASLLCRKRYADDKVREALKDGITLAAVDLEADDLTAALSTAGLNWNAPVMVVWEAVTQYLTEDTVRRTLARLTAAAPGSRLIFTYLRRDFLDGTRDYGAAAARREFVTRRRVWHFGLLPEETPALLREFGWTEREHVGPTEYPERYLRSLGRDLTVSPIERFVYADRRTSQRAPAVAVC